MSALPRPDLPPGPHRDLVTYLHDLHHRAGWPSLRTLARETGVSHTTVSKAFSRPGLPSWGTLELLVEAMSGDVADFHQVWFAASSPADGPSARAAGIAGRAAELAAVRRHLDSGTGLLLVTGEAGIGKSTVVAAAAHDTDTFVAVGHCLALSVDLPLLPFAEALRTVREVADGVWFEQALQSCPAYVHESLARMLPELKGAGVTDPGDEFARPRLFTATHTLLSALATRRPTTVLLEDLHWADATTLDLLAHLISQPGDVRVVATWRTRDAAVSVAHLDWLARIRQLGTASVLDLGLLTREETAEQLRQVRGAAVGDELVDQVFARGQGLPLFTTQLAVTGDALPQHLAELLDVRLGQLDGAEWEVARALGLAGRRLPSDVLRATTGQVADAHAGVLRVLAGRHLLRAGTGDDVELAHPLLIDAIRRRLVPGEAAAVHARIAECLEGRVDVEPGELARHWQHAGRPDREIGCRVAAARRAAERFARREELDSWLRALELWDLADVPDGIALWETLIAAIDAALEIAELATARTLAERATSLDLPDENRIHVARRAGAAFCAVGEQDRGQDLLDEAVGLIDSLPPSVELVDVLQDRIGYAGLTRLPAMHSAIQRAEAMLDVHEDAVRRRRLLTWSAWYELAVGDHVSALAVADRAREITVSQEDPNADVVVLIMATDLLLHAGASHEEVAATAEDGIKEIERWHRQGSTVDLILRINVCTAHLRAGDTRAASAIIDPVTVTPPNLATADAHVLRASVDVRLGRVADALERSHAAAALVPYRPLDAWLEFAPLMAEVELWADRPAVAAELVGEAVNSALPTAFSRMAAASLALRARAVADVLDVTRASAKQRRDAIQDLTVGVAAASVDPFGRQGIGVAVPALAATWRAELGRIGQREGPDAWDVAAQAWTGLNRPHDAAYCLWRAALCALRDGRGTTAARLLKRAAVDAREHAPLSGAISATQLRPVSTH